MKKYLLSLLAAAALMPAAAQTDFRHITFDQAKTAAKAEGKLIFVDFYTQWCGPCKRMAAQVFPKQEIGDYLNSGFVCLKLDAEAEGAELAKRVGIKAYPTLMVFDAEGKELGSFAGMKDGQEFITAVEMCKNPDLTPERVKERYASGERTPELVRAYAINIVESTRDYMAGYKQAGDIIDEYFASLTDKQRLDPAFHFLYDTYAWGLGTPRVQYLIANRNRFDASKSREISELLEKQFRGQADEYFTTAAVTTDEGRAAYSDFKRLSDELGYTPLYEKKLAFVDKHATLDTEAFIDYCDKNCDTLSADDLGMMLSALGRIFEPATPEQARKVTSIARKRLATLPANQLYWAASAIMELEQPRH